MKKRTGSVKQLLEQTDFFNPKTGFWGLDVMAKKLAKKANISTAEAKRAIKQTETYQRYKPHNRRHANKQKLKVKVSDIGYFQMDLADVSSFGGRINNNVKYWLMMIDIYSRKLWVVPLKSKSGGVVATAIDKVLKEFLSEHNNDRKLLHSVSSDNGSEFVDRRVGQVFEKYGMERYFAKVGDKHGKVSLVESSIKTMRQLVGKYLSYSGQNKYIDVLPQLVENYNNKQHSATNTAPDFAFKNRDIFPKLTKKQKEELKTMRETGEVPESVKKNSSQGTAGDLNVGDIVRVRMQYKNQAAFGKKSHLPTWSKELYMIESINRRRYVLQYYANFNTAIYEKGDRLPGTYAYSELLKVEFDNYQVNDSEEPVANVADSDADRDADSEDDNKAEEVNDLPQAAIGNSSHQASAEDVSNDPAPQDPAPQGPVVGASGVEQPGHPVAESEFQAVVEQPVDPGPEPVIQEPAPQAPIINRKSDKDEIDDEVNENNENNENDVQDFLDSDNDEKDESNENNVYKDTNSDIGEDLIHKDHVTPGNLDQAIDDATDEEDDDIQLLLPSLDDKPTLNDKTLDALAKLKVRSARKVSMKRLSDGMDLRPSDNETSDNESTGTQNEYEDLLVDNTNEVTTLEEHEKNVNKSRKNKLLLKKLARGPGAQVGKVVVTSTLNAQGLRRSTRKPKKLDDFNVAP